MVIKTLLGRMFKRTKKYKTLTLSIGRQCFLISPCGNIGQLCLMKQENLSPRHISYFFMH